jgi:hypothetical protein
MALRQLIMACGLLKDFAAVTEQLRRLCVEMVKWFAIPEN